MKKTKQCFKCGKRKRLTAFYAHPQMADGRLGKCKDCTKRDINNNRISNHEHYQAYEIQRRDLPHRVAARAAYASSDDGREAGKRAKQAWEARNPEKKKAATAVHNAVRDGKLIKKTECELCGSSKNIEAHHEDYGRPLEVIWLCKKHHWGADTVRREREREPITTGFIEAFLEVERGQ